MRIFLVAVLSFLSWERAAQEGLQFPDDNRNCKLTILAEYHGIAEVSALKNEMVEQLYDKANVKHIALETGQGAAYLWNEYIQAGDDAILRTLYPVDNKDILLQKLRKMQVTGKSITVHGIDFERMEALLAIKYLMDKKSSTDNKLYTYIQNKNEAIKELRANDKMRTERQRLLDECQTLYREHTKYYDSIKDGNFSVGEIFNNPASEMKFAKRDAAMAENMLPVLANAKENVLLIVGAYHITDNGKLYKRLVRDAKLERKDIRIVSMLCKNCAPRAMYFEQKKVPYLGYKIFVADTAVADKVFARYNEPKKPNIIRMDSEFYKEFGLKDDEAADYVMLLECRD